MQDAGAGGAATGRPPGATAPSYTTSIAHTIYVSVVRPKEVTESDQAAAETILQTSFGSSSSKSLLASLQENHGERLRLVLLHMGDTNTLAAVATLARLGGGRTLIENLCVRDQHRSRGLTRNLLDGIATSSADNDLFLFARSQVLLEVCQSSGYVCLDGDDRKRVVNTFVQETNLAYDSRYYSKVPLMKYASGTPRYLPGYNRSLHWEEEYGTRNGEDDDRNQIDCDIRRRARAVQVKRLPDGPVTPYESQAEAARSEGWSTSALSNWLCGKKTKCTIPAGYAIRRFNSDDWIRHDYEGTVDTTTSDDATTSGGVRNEEGDTRDKAVASVASNDATIGKVPSRGATTPRCASSTRDEDGFLKEGPYMNCRLRIQRPRYTAYGTVVKYLPGSENDGIELWKVRHDDGDEEDVEFHELKEWTCKRLKGV